MQFLMLNLMAAGCGGFLGSVCRYLVSISTRYQYGLNVATILVNVSGSILIGILAVVFLKYENTLLKNLCMTGLLGGFTTFSTFSLDALKLLMQGEVSKALIYILLSLFLGLTGCALGYFLGRYLI